MCLCDNNNLMHAKLQGARALCTQAVLQSFEAAGLSSQILRDLTTPGRRLPNLGGALKELLQAADWEAAAQQGRIVPNQVM